MKRFQYGKDFYTSLGKLVVPIVIQNLLSAMVNSADVVMLNYVGQSAISAVSLATQYAGVLFMVYYGLGTGATMLNAQYYGKGDLKAVRVVQGIALRFSLLIAGAAALLCLLAPRAMMIVFTNDQELIALGAQYLRVASVAYLCSGVCDIYLATLRSTGRVKVSTILNTMAFVLNIILNAVFIFGLFGAPKLGVTGVALATSLSRFVELIGCFLVSAKNEDVKLDFSYIFVRNPLLFGDFLKMAVPALLNDVSWSLAFSMYSVILGHLGSDVVAANSFVIVVRNFSTVFCFSVASGGGILLGNVIGEGRMEDAKRYASGTLFMTVVTGLIGSVLILAASPFILSYASLTEQASGYLRIMLLINTYYIIGSAVNTTLIAGVFRAGGDSRFGVICDTIDMWVYAVPLGFISAFVLKLPVMVVYFLICTDEFVKWPWVLGHYASGKWLKNITRDNVA